MTAYEKRNLFKRYKHDALFRQWLPTLGMLSRAGQGNEVEIWHETEHALHHLKQEAEWRDAEVQFIYTDLCERYPSRPIFCLTVMAVLFTCLADATPGTDRADENPYAPICVAICSMLGEDQRFHVILDAFFSHTCDNRGERVVLPVTDYLAMIDDEEDSKRDLLTTENDTNVLKQMVKNALERDDTNKLNALKLRLYELENPIVTHPLIASINERIAALTNPLPVTQNIFYNGANQINQSTLQAPVFCTGETDKPLTQINHG